MEKEIDADSGLKYSLKLSGKGLSFDGDVDQSAALAIINIALTGASPGFADGDRGGRATKPPKAEARTSLRAYIDQVGAEILSAKIVGIAAYRREVEGTEEFTQEDISGRFKGAGESAPSNLPRDFRTAVGQGWIAEDHQSPGTYFITKQGDEALAAKFEGVRGSTGRKPKRRKKTDEHSADGTGSGGR